MKSQIINLGIIGPENGIGQLGMLLAWEANKLHCSNEVNLSIKTLSTKEAPEWSDEHFYKEDLEVFLKNTEIIIYETESISEHFRQNLSSKIQPSIQSLNIFRNRYQEKSFFKNLNFGIPSFYYIKDENDLNDIYQKILSQKEKTFRLKTCELGYDGHGQETIDSSDKLNLAWAYLGKIPCLLEEEINIFRELSIIGTRFNSGEIIYFPIPQNIHQKGILYRSRSATVSKKIKNNLQNILQKILNELNYIGTFALEVFQIDDKNGALLLNEGAPRVHNSGHFTLDFCSNTNQFSAHIKAICNLPPIEPIEQYKFFSMTNLLSCNFDKYENIKEELDQFIDSDLNIFYYWYNKAEVRPKRKMGHITIISNNLKKLEKVEKFIDEFLAK